MDKYQEIFNWFENLQEGDLARIDHFYDPEAIFKDPFNELKGITKIKLIFEEMFENLERPQFVVIDKVVDGNTAFITWDFNFQFKGKPHSIHGGTFFKIGEDEKIILHRDYWDVGEELLAKIPVIKFGYNLFRKKLSVDKGQA